VVCLSRFLDFSGGGLVLCNRHALWIAGDSALPAYSPALEIGMAVSECHLRNGIVKSFRSAPCYLASFGFGVSLRRMNSCATLASARCPVSMKKLLKKSPGPRFERG